MPELELSPHELFFLPPETPAKGEAFAVDYAPRYLPAMACAALARPVLQSVDEREPDYQKANYIVFYCDPKRPERGVWSGGTAKAPAWNEPVTESQARDLITRSAQYGSPTRTHHRANSQFGLTIYQTGAKAVVTDQDNPTIVYKHLLPKPFGDFFWRDFADEPDFWNWNDFRATEADEALFCSWNSAEFEEFCERLWDDPNSQLNVFLRFQALSDEEKTALTLRCEIGDWAQLMRLCACVLTLIAAQFGPFPDGQTTGKNSFWAFSVPTSTTNVRTREENYPAGLFARRWQSVLFPIIKPAFWPNEPLCQFRWRKQDANHLIVQLAKKPTKREVLEAKAQLREFLSPFLSAPQIGELFLM